VQFRQSFGDDQPHAQSLLILHFAVELHIRADAADLLGTGLRERLRICPGPGCAGRFLDDSPAGRRRWCSMAVCGNRNKAAAHRQAAHAAAGRA